MCAIRTAFVCGEKELGARANGNVGRESIEAPDSTVEKKPRESSGQMARR